MGNRAGSSPAPDTNILKRNRADETALFFDYVYYIEATMFLSGEGQVYQGGYQGQLPSEARKLPAACH
jgi:hypothetical protein